MTKLSEVFYFGALYQPPKWPVAIAKAGILAGMEMGKS